MSKNMKLLSTKDISIVSVAFNKIMSSSIFRNQFFEIIKSLQKEKKNWLLVRSQTAQRLDRYMLRQLPCPRFSSVKSVSKASRKTHCVKGPKGFLVLLNPFVPNAPFLYPLKISKNLKVF